jgi:hypothetical protein
MGARINGWIQSYQDSDRRTSGSSARGDCGGECAGFVNGFNRYPTERITSVRRIDRRVEL